MTKDLIFPKKVKCHTLLSENKKVVLYSQATIATFHLNVNQKPLFMFSVTNKILITNIILLSGIWCKAQTKFDTPIPCIYWFSDTSTTWSTGAFKYSTAIIKRKGYVVYKDTNEGIIYSYLDGNRQPINNNYMVLWDNKDSRFINFKGTMFPNAIVKKGITVDTVYTKQ